MAEIIWGGEPANDAEREVIRHLRDRGPDSWKVVHNIELGSGRSTREIDLIVLTTLSVFFLDTKGSRGRVTVNGRRWHPERGNPFFSPLPKIHDQARRFAGQLQRSGQPRLREVYVDAGVVFPFPDTELVDTSGRELPDTVHLNNLIRFLSDPNRVERGRSTNIRALHTDILRVLRATGRVPMGPKKFRNYHIVEELGGTVEFTDYRALQDNRREVLIRAYVADPYQPDSERTARQDRLRIAYDELCRLSANANIVTAIEFWGEEDESRFYLVTESRSAGSLRRRLDPSGAPLPDELRPQILSGILNGLAYAHDCGVLHRALTPDAVLLTADNTPLLTGFDYARGPDPRNRTVVGEIADMVDEVYLAPECRNGTGEFTTQSDCYAVGALGYELYAGAPPTGPGSWAEELVETGVSEHIARLIERLGSLDPQLRPSAAEARKALSEGHTAPPPSPAARTADYRALEPGHRLTPKYVIRQRLGAGSHGVVYRVYDELEDRDKVIKIIDSATDVAREPLQRELRTLQALPSHRNVVRVLTADFLPDGHTPYLSFEYLEGLSGEELVDGRVLGPQEVLGVAHDLIAGLVHIHENQPPVYHCDIKPANVLHTDNGSVLIDFNVAVSAGVDDRDAGATQRYLVPDFVRNSSPTDADYVDRDLFALGITLYELLLGAYPWNSRVPAIGEPPLDPVYIASDLNREFADVLLRLIDPNRAHRFRSAREVAAALRALHSARRIGELTVAAEEPGEMTANPFVAHLKTLYSQSTSSNRGTRGLDPTTHNLYVETKLDSHLREDVLHGSLKLVIITGNAGDGKTAFLERLATVATEMGAMMGPRRVNGAEFTFKGRTFRTNMDGSQDEDGTDNDDALVSFFAPFAGTNPGTWPSDQVRLIAINEGRLVDFVLSHEPEFPTLTQIINTAFDEPGNDDTDTHGVVVVSLNARSVTAADEGGDSIFLRVLSRMTDQRFWAACSSCELANRCYARHNAATFAHSTGGRRIAARLQQLYRLTHQRGRLHITLRDLRSAIAFMLTSGRDCAEIHDLYSPGSDPREVLDSYYFTSWRGMPGTKDRLLGLLADVDMAAVPNPQLDRQLTYRGPARDHSMLAMEGRANYDQELLDHLFTMLPRGVGRTSDSVIAYQSYLAAARRRYFFECLDEKRSHEMLPYLAAGRYLNLLSDDNPARGLDEILDAINRGEGWYHLDPSDAGLVLQVRHVSGGTIRSYRSFPASGFSLVRGGPRSSRYLEVEPDHLVLRHDGGVVTAELPIWLDLFELLHRRGLGYRAGDPDAADLGLRTFRHQLAAAPYQEVLLTVNGVDGHRIRRDGHLLTMSTLQQGADRS